VSWEVINGKCEAEMPKLIERGLTGHVVVTDQPYGTGWARGGGKKVGEFFAKHEQPAWDVFSLKWLATVGDPKRLALFAPVSRAEEVAEALPNRALCYYRKTNARPGAPAREPIIVSPAPVNPEPWDFTAYNGDSPYHPCQKPLELMRWLVRLVSDPSDTIVDPFAGSFTTGVACIIEGRNFIGIEQDEHYCRIGEARLKRASGIPADIPGPLRNPAPAPLFEGQTNV